MHLATRMTCFALLISVAFVSCRDFDEGGNGADSTMSSGGAGGTMSSGGAGGQGEAEGLAGELQLGSSHTSDDAAAGYGGGAGGTGSESVAAGAGGQAGRIGEAIDINEPEPVLVPSCRYSEEFVPTSAVALAFSRTYAPGEAELYTWDPASNTALVRWADAKYLKTGWSPWVCFDLLPGVTRLAAANLPNNYALALAVANERVFVRHEASPNWAPWLPLGLPSRLSVIDDVAASSGRLPRVYIVDRGQVFYRSKVATDTYADWGVWAAISANDTVLLAADQDASPVPVVATLSSSGEIAVASQPLESNPFEDWIALPQLDQEVIDLDVVAGDDVDVFALDATGCAWVTRIGDDDGWRSLVDPNSKVFIQAIATSPAGGVYGIDAGADVYGLDIEQREWKLIVNKFGG